MSTWYATNSAGVATHHKKASAKRQKQPAPKGMTPIIKNIIVLDELGRELEPTYPKRAKGLVKNGRARYVNESTICLFACSSNNKSVKETNDMSGHTDLAEKILSAVKDVIAASDYLNGAFTTMQTVINNGESDSEDLLDKAAEVVRYREVTNQKALALLERVYEKESGNSQ